MSLLEAFSADTVIISLTRRAVGAAEQKAGEGLFFFFVPLTPRANQQGAPMKGKTDQFSEVWREAGEKLMHFSPL